MCSSDPSKIAHVVPDRDSPSTREGLDELLSQLVTANHILFERGVLDAFGHISVRHPNRPDRYFLARNKAPGVIVLDDIIEFDLDSNPLDADGRPVYLERFIHGETYKARPDVMAVAHSHSPTVVPFTIVKNTPFRAVCHMAGFIGAKPPVFEIRDAAGDGTDLLIRSPKLGSDMARVMGESDIVLMRGHGVTVVGHALKQVVFRAVYTEVNARTQAVASTLGEIISLTDREAQATVSSIEGQAERAWGLWERSAAMMHNSLINA